MGAVFPKDIKQHNLKEPLKSTTAIYAQTNTSLALIIATKIPCKTHLAGAHLLPMGLCESVF